MTRTMLAATLAPIAPFAIPTAAQERKPNIVFMIVDNLGYGAFRCGIRDGPLRQVASWFVPRTSFRANLLPREPSPACPDGGGGSAKPRPERQHLLAGRSADHDTLERCHG